MSVHRIQGGYANTYLIEDGNSLVAVDVGTAAAADSINDYVHDQNRSLPPLRMVTATHFHIDHVGGISRMVQLFPELRVCFVTAVGDYLQRRKKLALFPPAKWLKGLKYSKLSHALGLASRLYSIGYDSLPSLIANRFLN